VGRLRNLARKLLGRADIYQSSLKSLISKRGTISVVIIGANDGKINDPFYAIARKFPKRTSVILVEPQQSLHPFLRQNYAFHPRHKVVSGAVGSEATLTLFAVKPHYWAAIRPAYATGWPEYRAATGVTSSDRDQVAQWVARFGDGLSPDDAIEQLSVKCWTLPALLKEAGARPEVDVIQIDAEGTDDFVLYSCAIEETQPSVILMETKTIPPDRKHRLDKYLQQQGFRLRARGGDTLAVREVLSPAG
jgi:FkbM family methyltransferase